MTILATTQYAEWLLLLPRLLLRLCEEGNGQLQMSLLIDDSSNNANFSTILLIQLKYSLSLSFIVYIQFISCLAVIKVSESL